MGTKCFFCVGEKSKVCVYVKKKKKKKKKKKTWDFWQNTQKKGKKEQRTNTQKKKKRKEKKTLRFRERLYLGFQKVCVSFVLFFDEV